MEIYMDSVRKDLLESMGFLSKAIKILDNNINMYTLENPTITEKHQGSCGDILFLSLRISNNIIENSAYEYIGCAGLQACASALTEMIKGKSIDEVVDIEVNDIIEYLEGIPKQKYECAEISRDTLRKALKKWKELSTN